MKKTSLYLDLDIDAFLARRAAHDGVTKAEFIRRILRQAVDGDGSPRPRAVGLEFDAPSDVAEDVDRYLTEYAFGRR
ncbi:MAG: CopG family transcriptional regulator [Solirubrobacteraceae bacterium]